jgi:methionyl aminopeptidase
VLKTHDEIAKMRRAGRVVAEMHEKCREAAVPGVTTANLDKVARAVLEKRGARSNFLNYHGFPAVICTSPNDTIVHGIPGAYRLREGDILSIDCGAIIEGWHADAAITIPIGTVDDDSTALMDTTRRSLDAAIELVREGKTLGDIGAAVQGVAEAGGYSVVREYVGHGIGRAMHEEPDVENRGRRGKGPRLEPGVVLAIEPMLIAGGRDDVAVLDDHWTVVTADGSVAAHTEHTVVVTDHGPEILTRL